MRSHRINADGLVLAPAVRVNPVAVKEKAMRVGCVSYWFERGQAYVTKNVMQAIENDCEVFVFARSDNVNPIGSGGEWDIPNLTKHERYYIPHDLLRKWIQDNDLDLVFFNEEYDFALVEMVKKMGVMTMGIYYWELFDPRYTSYCNVVYDAIICPTMACFQKFKDLGVANIHHIKWGVDLDVFKPVEREPNERVRFFHPAGWGGMHNRRGTEYVIEAFKRMENDAELMIHSQHEAVEMDQQNGVSLINGNVSRETLIEMYQKSDVVVLPSMWEGLGLTFLEAIGCGLPIITVDAPPMNEFVEHSGSGYCCEVTRGETHSDIFVTPAIVDVVDLAKAMDTMTGREYIEWMRNVTIDMRSEWDWKENSLKLRDLILDLGESERKTGESAELDAITALIQDEGSPDVLAGADTRQYARFHKICADDMLKGRVLDVGCKHGTLAMMLADRFDVVAIDKDYETLEMAKRIAKDREIYIDFGLTDIATLPFLDKSFDTVILSQVLEYVRDPEDLSELMRVLKPDGCLIITTNVGFAHWDPDHKWFFWPDKTYEMLKGGWSFMEQNGDPAFLKLKGSAPFGAFIEKYLGEAYGYQVYNNHESQHPSLEIYARVYKPAATLIPFPEIAGDEVIFEQLLNTAEMREAGVV